MKPCIPSRLAALLAAALICLAPPALAWQVKKDGATQLKLDDNGSLGVGRAPDGNFRMSVQDGQTSGHTALFRSSSSSGTYLGILNDSGSAGSFYLTVWPSGSFGIHKPGVGDRLTIDSTGKVGIGTTTPVSLLHVGGVVTVGNRVWGSSVPGVDHFWLGLNGSGTDGQRVAIGIGANDATSGTVGVIDFRTNDASRMHIDNTGNVGIGTTTPGSGVDMKGGLSINGTGATQFAVQNNGANAFALNVGSGGNWLMYDRVGGIWNPSITSSGGNVGVGIVTPTAKLEVAGQVKITGGSPGAGKVLTSDANGLASWQTASGGGAVSGTVVGGYDDRIQRTWGAGSITINGPVCSSGSTVRCTGPCRDGVYYFICIKD